MSLRSSIRKKPQVNLRAARLQDAQERVSDSARRAARQMGPTSRKAREVAAEKMLTARGWSAPRLDQAGHYVEQEVGPRVGALLRRTAGRVDPAKPRRSRRGFAALLLAAGGALGAAGAIATRRSASRSADESPSSADHLSAVTKNSNAERAHTP